MDDGQKKIQTSKPKELITEDKQPDEASVEKESVVTNDTTTALQSDNNNANLNNDEQKENGGINNTNTGSPQPPPAKRQKKTKGQNKSRPRTVPKVADQYRICPNVHRGTQCRFGDKCRFAHDVHQYMATKPADIGEHCVNYQLFGKCKYGVECRFAKNHLVAGTLENMVDEERYQEHLKTASSDEKAQNVLTKELMNRLRKRQFKYEKTGRYNNVVMYLFI